MFDCCLDGATRRQKSKIQNLNCTNVGERRVKEMFFLFSIFQGSPPLDLGMPRMMRYSNGTNNSNNISWEEQEKHEIKSHSRASNYTRRRDVVELLIIKNKKKIKLLPSRLCISDEVLEKPKPSITCDWRKCGGSSSLSRERRTTELEEEWEGEARASARLVCNLCTFRPMKRKRPRIVGKFFCVFEYRSLDLNVKIQWILNTYLHLSPLLFYTYYSCCSIVKRVMIILPGTLIFCHANAICYILSAMPKTLTLRIYNVDALITQEKQQVGSSGRRFKRSLYFAFIYLNFDQWLSFIAVNIYWKSSWRDSLINWDRLISALSKYFRCAINQF